MKFIKRLFATLTASAMILSATAASAVSRPAAVRRDIAVRKISFNNPEFIRGMDISSVISLENSGVSFRNAEGEAEDIFKILSDSGVNYIRVRVWNNPYDKDKNGYGGGNSDLEKAKIIGRRAAENGMKLLVDFHYSDFWADPAKQQEPKEWKNLSVSEKCEKLYDYTKTSLDAIKDDGGDVGMVQIGNETTTGIAGEYATSNVAKLYKSGIKAVRDFDKAVLTVIHFTNPERTEATKDLADMLSDNQVDYDVFAVSYYPYWHGSLENLTDVLSYAAKTYGKYVMVAETSYAYTLDDSDPTSSTTAATYTAPIKLTESCTIKAAAFNYGNSKNAWGAVSSASYTVSAPSGTTYTRVTSLSSADVGRKFIIVSESQESQSVALGEMYSSGKTDIVEVAG